jgi:hypothetical protein
MGKILRTACTIVPIVPWIVGSFICLLFVMFGQLQTPATVAGHDLYFVKVGLSVTAVKEE